MQIKYSNKTFIDRPVCTICIANYNGIGVIEECLNSIMQQDCDFQIEVIVHDDASTDGSVEFIQKQFPEVVLISSENNVGFCVSNNRMVEKARGKYLLIINNDAALYPDALRYLYEKAESVLRPAILGLQQYDAETGELIDSGVILDPFMNSIPNQNLNRNHVAMMIGACMFMPKSLWEEVGGFPKWFHTMHEDMYICCMARLYGYSVQIIDHSGYKHWVGKSLGGGKVDQKRISTNITRRMLSERNRIYVMVLCYPNPFLGIILPLHLLLLLVEGIALSLIKKDRTVLHQIYLSAMKSGWVKRKKLYDTRKYIQKQKRINSTKFLSAFSPVPHKLRMLMKYGIPEIT